MNSTFIDELKQELRQDTMVSLWRKYKYVIYVAIVVVIVGTAGGVWWKSSNRTSQDTAGNAFFSTMNLIGQSDGAKGLTELDVLIKSNTGYAPFAVAKKAALLQEQGKNKEAAEVIGTYLTSAKTDSLTKELLALQQARYLLAVADAPAVTVPGSPKLQGMWEEYRALVALGKGDKTEAAKLLLALESDLTAPSSLRTRARDIAESIDPHLPPATTALPEGEEKSAPARDPN
ncbi:MAG: tetratricopeptide repeat protein [Rickettsiales bacterium]|jgi:hypothetical protein|nr:tetratricopeptide repeat protein [Rickettsiales bacterium]